MKRPSTVGRGVLSASILWFAVATSIAASQDPAAQQPAQPQPTQPQPTQAQPIQDQPAQQQPLQPIGAQPQAEPVQPLPLQQVQAAPLLAAGYAQRRTYPMRPYRGLFGGSAIGPTAPGLSATLASYAGYDDDLLRAQSSGGTRASGVGGSLYGGSAGLAYDRPGNSVAIGATYAADFRGYPSLDHSSMDHLGTFAVDFAVGRKMRIAAAQSFEYGSLFRFSDLAGLGLPPGGSDADYAVSDRKRIVSGSSVTARYRLDARSELVTDADYFVTDAQGFEFDRRMWAAGGAYVRDISRRFSINIGYRYQEGKYGDPLFGRRTKLNSILAGADYEWQLSFSRRTTVTFSGGGGKLSREVGGVQVADALQFTGTIDVAHLIGRTWTLEGRYYRGLQFAELIPDPFFVDSVRASLRGMMSRRLEFRALGSYSSGHLSVTGTGPQRTSYGAGARLAYAFSTALEMALDYSYQYYDFSEDEPVITPELTPTLDRQTVRLSIRYWIPLFVTR
jgi:hypothetical protein